MHGPFAKSPPTTNAPQLLASWAIPSASSSIHSILSWPVRVTATTKYFGEPPIAYTSAKFAAAILRPISNALLHLVEKCVPSTAISVVMTVRSVVVTTAPSSPIPISTPR